MKEILIVGLILISQFSFGQTQGQQNGQDFLEHKSGAHVDSLGMATGLYFVYEAFQNFKKGDAVADGLTSGALGLSTVLGAVTFSARAGAAPTDPVKAFMKTDDYKKLVDKLGEKKAKEFILDTQAGWTIQALNKKYGSIYGVTFDSTSKAENHAAPAPDRGSDATN